MMYRANHLMPTFFESCGNCEEKAEMENSRETEQEKEEKEQIFKDLLYRIFQILKKYFGQDKYDNIDLLALSAKKNTL